MTDTKSASAWIRSFHPKESGAARLVCFPHAGGAAKAFAGLSAALPADVELLAVQYPGRQDRHAEPCAGEIEALAAGTAEALAAYGDRPLFLLGHSMGALVAFETARLLAERGAVARVFVSAARPPSQDWQEPDVDALADEQVLSELRRLGGVPEPLLRDPESVREILRVLRADHRALRRYLGRNEAAVAVPITVLLADADPKNTLEQMRDWSRHTTRDQGVEMLSGGHFSLVEQPDGAVPVLVRHIRADIAAASRHEPGAASRHEPAAASRPAPADLVRDILVAGLGGRKPRLSTDLTTLEDAAREVLAPDAYGYAAGNSGTGATGRANREAFDRWRLLPRMLRGTGPRELSVSLLGERLPAPVLLAPVAAQTVVHPEGELAAARGAADAGVPLVLSTFASHSLEDVAKEAGPGPRWFQLYMPSQREVAESLVRRAEASGYTALVLTVDAPNFGYRPADLDAAYSPFLRGTGIANFTGDPAFLATLPPDADTMAMVVQWASVSTDPAFTWAGLPWLRELTRLPILVKGLLHPDDARLALEHGANGVIVSNHGGRQLDGGVAALDALPAVRAAVGEGVPVLMDSGVRTGTDVVKALALGADAVLYGRPYLYGLALDGRQGVEHVLRCLLAEIDLALGLSGCASAADVTAGLVVPRDQH
ncbi:alpha-hydroxy-acid oxidizing protein [Actinomadura rubrisoli]|uniref:Alpha/beta fold hydrolase n=1 Tax=Actinomadura rubrisoli TaxID=2530368 RepID=A0A4R5C1G3_9ACTN|nr:alpha-hydroxy-acid oxidizing protein [Actinomadura rubrisoli]TDD92605.1 alpha/beta fold hydrolase [Actinomadura rubrisoli]